MSDKLHSVETDQVHEEAVPCRWETHHVSLMKVPVFGFGIAVSGGYDSPHFASGDPSVAISDVLRGGPAEGKLELNDRIVAVNGVSLENVNHNRAINVLRDCGNVVNLVVRRRISLATLQDEFPTAEVTLIRKNNNDDFGIVLQCKVLIKEIIQNSPASQEPSLHIGDIVYKVNDCLIESILMAEVKNLIHKGKDKLNLAIVAEDKESLTNMSTRPQPRDSRDEGSSLAYADSDSVAASQISKTVEEDVYVRDPTTSARYSRTRSAQTGRQYSVDSNTPSWATLPRNVERKASKRPIREHPHRRQQDAYHSDADDGSNWAENSTDVPGSGRPGSRLANKSLYEVNPRSVTFYKKRQMSLGLKLAGGNVTGIFIASVEPGSAADRQGLVMGDKIIFTNGRDMRGMIREEAVSFLTKLEGKVTLVVQYRKEDYDQLMSSNEAGDSFYVRTHFRHTVSDSEIEHAFKVGDIFHVKDTLFRGVGGSWLAIRVSEGLKQNRKGTIPNSSMAEILKSHQKDENPAGTQTLSRRPSLFRRKSRLSRSLGKEQWERLIFAGFSTRFPAYERVLYREPGFVRPVVLFGAIADVARERLVVEHPDRFHCLNIEKSGDEEKQNNTNVGVTVAVIQKAIGGQKHCLLDITPSSVDKLNYAQYNPIVIYLKAENKQAVKDIRSRWKANNKSSTKLLEQSLKVERSSSHLFTGQLTYTDADVWFSELCEMIYYQQRRKIWISEKQPEEDFRDELMFSMSSRMSSATGASSSANLSRLQSDLDIPSSGMQQVERYLSDPNVNSLANKAVADEYSHWGGAKNAAFTSENFTSAPYYTRDVPGYTTRAYTDEARAHINPYATLTPAEKIHSSENTGSSHRSLVFTSSLQPTTRTSRVEEKQESSTAQVEAPVVHDENSKPQQDLTYTDQPDRNQTWGRTRYDHYRINSVNTSPDTNKEVDKSTSLDIARNRTLTSSVNRAPLYSPDQSYLPRPTPRYSSSTSNQPLRQMQDNKLQLQKSETSDQSGNSPPAYIPSSPTVTLNSSAMTFQYPLNQQQKNQHWNGTDRSDSVVSSSARPDHQSPKAFTNEVYMNQRELQLNRQVQLQPTSSS